MALIAVATGAAAQGAHDELITRHAIANEVPEALVRRVITIESRGNPAAVNGDNYGLMQIRLGTARAMGYDGSPQGLLDADTNMKFAVKYLAGAYRAAGCDVDLAVAYYQHGYVSAGKIKCPVQFAVATAESKPAERPAQPAEVRPMENSAAPGEETRPVETTSAEKSAADTEREILFGPSLTKPQTVQPFTPSDVLKPRAVQTVTIQGHSAGAAAPAPALQPDAKAPEPEATPTTFAARMELVAAPLQSTTGARADLEPQEALQPETKKAERRAAPKREKHVARTPAKKRVARHAPEDKKPEAQGDLISALKRLVTPETKPPARKSKKPSQS